jgi:tetratricopeptide (TPR) repeat protein
VNLIWWLKISLATGRKDHKRVVELSLRELEKDPQNVSALSFAATHSEAFGDFEKATHYASKALASDPDDFDLHCLLIRNLDPTKDREALFEQAKWLIAISETTLPNQMAQFQKLLRTIEYIPFSGKARNGAEQDFYEQRQYQGSYLQWAKDFLSSQNVSPA